MLLSRFCSHSSRPGVRQIRWPQLACTLFPPNGDLRGQCRSERPRGRRQQQQQQGRWRRGELDRGPSNMTGVMAMRSAAAAASEAEQQ